MYRLVSTSLALVAALVGPASSSDLDAARESGSVRFLNWTSSLRLQEHETVEALQAFVLSSARLGFDVRDPNAAHVGLRKPVLQMRPALEFDGNANGGNPSGRLDLGAGQTLQFDADSLKESATLAGVSLAASAQFDYGRGKYLTVGANLTSEWALSEPLQKTAANISACSNNHLFGWTFLDLCASRNIERKKLSTDTETEISAGIDQMVETGRTPAEVGVTLVRRYRSHAVVNGVGTKILTLAGDASSFEIAAEHEFREKNLSTSTLRLSVTARTRLAGRSLKVFAANEKIEGGMILGREHQESKVSFGVSVPIEKFGLVNVSSFDTRSTMSFFEDRGFSVSLQLLDFRKLMR